MFVMCRHFDHYDGSLVATAGITCSNSQANGTQCQVDKPPCSQLMVDAYVLLDWKSSLSDPALVLSSWQNHTSPCVYWNGITCNKELSSVVGISLPFANLSGPLPRYLTLMLNLEVTYCRAKSYNPSYRYRWHSLLMITNISYVEINT